MPGIHIEQRPDGLYTLYAMVPVMDHLRPEQIVQAMALVRGGRLEEQVRLLAGAATGTNGNGAHAVLPEVTMRAPGVAPAPITTAERLQQEELEVLLGKGVDIEGSNVRTTDPRLMMIAFKRGTAPTGWSQARAQQWMEAVFAKSRDGKPLKLDRTPYQIHSPKPGITAESLASFWYFSVRPASAFKTDTARTLTLANGIELIVADPSRTKYASLTARQL